MAADERPHDESSGTPAPRTPRTRPLRSGRERRAPEGSDLANGRATGRAEAVAVSDDMLDELLGALLAVRDGDFSTRLPTRRVGVMGEIALAFNQMADTNARMTKELQRVGRVVGR